MNVFSLPANATWGRRIFASIVAVVIVCIVCLALGVGAVRTFLVDATVRGLDITFEGQTNYWDLGPVTLCVPLEKLNLRAARGDGACDARRYVEQQDDLSIEWSDGASVIVERNGATEFSLTVTGQSTLTDRTRIVVAQDNWSMIGTLSFVGYAVLGRPAGSGETRLLLGADYQVREKPFGSGHTETIKSGTVRKGESVSLIQRTTGTSTLATVYGYITPSTEATDALDIGIVSQAGDIAMSVRFFGGDIPAEIAPNWIDRTLSSPLVLALAFLLSVGLGAVQLFLGVRPFRTTPALQKTSAHQAQLRSLTRYSGTRRR
jgi:hypothetical protein